MKLAHQHMYLHYDRDLTGTRQYLHMKHTVYIKSKNGNKMLLSVLMYIPWVKVRLLRYHRGISDSALPVSQKSPL